MCIYFVHTNIVSKVAEIGNQVSTDDPNFDSIVNSPNSLSIIVQLQTEIGFKSNLFYPLALLQILLVPLLCIIRILKEKEGSPLVMLCSYKYLVISICIVMRSSPLVRFCLPSSLL